VAALSIVACGPQVPRDGGRQDSPAATQQTPPVLADDAENPPHSPATPADEAEADEPSGDVQAVEAPANDEPAYHGVPLSTHIHELNRGEYVEALHYRHVYDRPKYAEQAFRHIGARAAEPLARALKDESLVVRWNAIEALKQIGPEAKAATGALVAAATKDEDFQLRREAVIALGAIGPDVASAIPDLAKLLRMTKQHFVAPHGFWRISDAARDTLVEIGPDALPVLVAALNDKDPTVRLISAQALGRFGAEADTVVPLLQGLLKDEQPVVRAVAAKSLGRLGPAARAAAADLARLLTDYSKYGVGVLYSGNVAAEASQALSRVGATIAEIPALTAIIEQEAPEIGNDGTGKASNDWVRWYVARSLGELGASGKPAVAALNRLLKNDRLRCAVAVALLQIDPGRTDLPRDVEKCLSDRDLDPRLCALRAFRRAITPDDEALDKLRSKAQAQEGISSILAAAAVLRSAPGDADMTQAMKDLLGNGGDDVWHPHEYQIEQWGDDLLDVFGTCPEAADAGLRTALSRLHDSSTNNWALKVLGRIGGRGASVVDELTALLGQEDDTETRRVAAAALGRIGPAAREAVTALVHALRDPRAVVRAAAAESLDRIGIAEPSVTAGLESCLMDEYVVVRQNAVRALGKMSSAARSTLPQIDRMRDDPSPTVRRLACEAARTIRGTP